jgi:hypothetical protein
VPLEQKLLFARKTQSEVLKLPVFIKLNGMKFLLLILHIGTDGIMIIVSEV